jgi:hypothetical protein
MPLRLITQAGLFRREHPWATCAALGNVKDGSIGGKIVGDWEAARIFDDAMPICARAVVADVANAKTLAMNTTEHPKFDLFTVHPAPGYGRKPEFSKPCL